MNKREKIARLEHKYDLIIKRWDNDTGRIIASKHGYDFELNVSNISRFKFLPHFMTWESHVRYLNDTQFNGSGLEVACVSKTHITMRNKLNGRLCKRRRTKDYSKVIPQVEKFTKGLGDGEISSLLCE